MQNDRSSSQFSLHLQYISRKEMITARKTIRSTPSYRAIPSCLVEGSRSEGRNERKTSGEMRRGGGQYLGRASKSFLQRAWRVLFSIFFKIFAFNFKDRRNSTRFSSVSRVVTLRGKKEEEREQKRGEGKRRGDGRKRGRKTKETARGGKSRTQWREWKGRRRKGEEAKEK